MKDIASINRKIFRGVAFAILLFFIFLFLSMMTKHFYLLGKGFTWVFGLTGLWILLPLLIAFALIVFIVGSFPKWMGIRLFLGILIALLGIASLWAHLGLNGTEAFALNDYNAAYSAKDSLYFSHALGGGLIGTELASLFLAIGNGAFVYLFAIVLLLLGLLVAFLPLIQRFFRFLSKKIAIASSKKASKKEAEKTLSSKEDSRLTYQKAEPLQERPNLYHEEEETSPIERPAFRINPAPSLSRLEKGEPLEEKPAPKVQPATVDAYRPQQNYDSELKEAVFLIHSNKDDAEENRPATFHAVEEAYRAKTREVEAEPLAKEEKTESPIETKIEPSPIQEEREEKEEEAPFTGISPLQEEKPVIPTVEEEPYCDPTRPVFNANGEAHPSLSVETAKAAEGIKEEKPAPMFPLAKERPPYQFPGVDLLKDYPDNGQSERQKEECENRKEEINRILDGFKAGARVVSYTIGPSVTRYNIAVDPGVAVSTINRYISNISVALGGVPTRFEEVVPGQNTSGLEIANDHRRTVSFKEIVESLPQRGDKNNLYIPFGQSISGQNISSDLSEFPHMLVCGSTGSGKSIFMHGLILSLIMRNRPEDLKLVMVDPKQVEMAAYSAIPHLLCPIITEPQHAKVCTQKLIDEMERRYTMFRNAGVRNIREFNDNIAEENGYEKLPFIVFIVDEFADLMNTCKDIGDYITRIAAKARAAGIHMVIATQRPTIDVITGTIKANIIVRVALSVASPVDSMTIINQKGAEELAGNGDMLVQCGKVLRNGVFRVQGCFVDTKEVANVVNFIKEQVPTVYDPRFLDLEEHQEESAEAPASGGVLSQNVGEAQRSSGGDPRYEEVKRVVMQQEYYSISRLTREFGFGFTRAGKVFRMLQADGILGSSETSSNSKGCPVLIHSDGSVSNEGSSDQSEFTPNNEGF